MTQTRGRYGFTHIETAERQAAALRQRHPENKYEVAVHRHIDTLGVMLGRVTRASQSVTYGVVRYVPYIPAMPWRHDGFVWFDGLLD